MLLLLPALALATDLYDPVDRVLTRTTAITVVHHPGGDRLAVALDGSHAGIVVPNGPDRVFPIVGPAEWALDVDGDGTEELVADVWRGAPSPAFPQRAYDVVFTDADTGAQVATVPVLGPRLERAVLDVDGDGDRDLVLYAPGTLEAYDLSSYALVAQADAGERGHTFFAQLDGDPALEMVVDGSVYDALTGVPERAEPGLGPRRVPTLSRTFVDDFDGDGLDDVVLLDQGEWRLWLQADRRVVRTWAGLTSGTVGADLVDLDADGEVELMSLRGGNGAALELTTMELRTGELRLVGSLPTRCTGMQAYRPAAGAVFVNCVGALHRLDGSTLTPPVGPPGFPRSLDVDGDGSAEIVLLRGAVAKVLDATGSQTVATLPAEAPYLTLADLDRDGVDELVSTDDGVTRWRADPVRGWRPRRLPVPPTTLSDAQIVDADGDGWFDVFFDDAGTVSRLDTLTGATTPLFRSEIGGWHLEDLDGDGVRELLVDDDGSVRELSGAVRLSGIGRLTRATWQGSPALVGVQQGDAVVHRVSGTQLVEVHRAPFPEPTLGPVSWDGERFWAPVVEGHLGWNPVDDSQVLLHTTAPISERGFDPYVRVEDLLFVRGDDVYEVWSLP